MNLLQALCRTHFNVIDKAAFKKFISLLLTFFIGQAAIARRPTRPAQASGPWYTTRSGSR